MIEILKPVKKKKIGIEAIHGHTCIELKDVRTGIRDRIESDNAVTDGAESLLRSLGAYKVCIVDDNSSANSVPVGARLFGGILLFDDTIPTSPIAKYKPAGVKMVGNGSYKVANSSAVTEMGSYNEPESTLIANKFEQVYDFSTQQANGTIKSVCLTSMMAGYVGYGNSNSNVAHETKLVFNQTGSPIFDVKGVPMCRFSQVQTHNKVYYLISEAQTEIPANTTEITLYEKSLSIEEMDAFNEQSCGYTTAGGIIYFPVSNSWTITLPSHTARLAITHFEDKFYLIPGSVTIANGSSFDIYIVDPTTRTVTTKHITNNSGKSIYLNYVASPACATPVTEDIIFCPLGTNPYYLGLIDLVNGTVADSGNFIYPNGSSGYSFAEFDRITPTLIGLPDTTGGRAHMMYDIGNATFYYDNMDNHPAYGYKKIWYNSEYDSLEYYYLAGNTQECRMMPNPWRLTTINNLGSAVTKDATKTMKVTYTLTFS